MIIQVVVLLALLILGVPVGFTIGLTSLSIAFAEGHRLIVLAQRMFTGIDSFPFLAVPFFILAGKLMNATGITKDIVDFADTILGHITGGLAHVNIVASMFFAGITGSAVADTSAIGSILIPSMKEDGYDAEFSAAVTASSSVVGPIIPPSIPFVIFSLLTGASVGGLFMAGVIPGILLGLGLMIMAFIISKRRGYKMASERSSFKEMLIATKTAIIPLLMPIIILGGILSGVFTATEASAVAVIYAFFVGIILYRSLEFKEIYNIFVETAITTSVVFLIIAAAHIFNWLISMQLIPQMIAEFVVANFESKILFLLALNAILLFMGTFIEGTAAMILSVPVLMPAIEAFGISPLMFGVIVVLNLMLGLITPPLGLCLFVASEISGITIEEIFRGVIPFLAISIVVLLMVTFIEPITMFLPNLFGYF